MENASLSATLLNNYVRQNELHVLVNQLGVAVDQFEENTILLRSEQLDSNERATHLNSSSVRSDKLEAHLLFQIAAMDTEPRKTVRFPFLSSLDTTSTQSLTATQSGVMWKSRYTNSTPTVLRSDISIRKSWLLCEVVRVIALRCHSLLLVDNIPYIDGALRWAEQIQSSQRLGVALAFTVVIAWRRVASIGVRYAFTRADHHHVSSSAETNTAHDHVANRNQGYVDETLFFHVLCSPFKPPHSSFLGGDFPIYHRNNNSMNDMESFIDHGMLKDFAFAILRGHCRDVPLGVWSDFLSTAQFITHILAVIKTQKAKFWDNSSNFPSTLTQEAIVLRSLLLFSTGQSHVWTSALPSTCFPHSEERLNTWVVENVPEEVCFDVQSIFDNLKMLTKENEVTNNKFLLLSSLVLSDRYVLWLLLPYVTMWSRYCALSG